MPAALKISAQIGTVLLTGFEITRTLASGAEEATALARSRTMEALVLKRSMVTFNVSQTLSGLGVD